MNKYTLYWKNGTTEVIEGLNILDAFKRAGHSSLDLAQKLDFYSVGEEVQYFWTGKFWTRLIKGDE